MVHATATKFKAQNGRGGNRQEACYYAVLQWTISLLSILGHSKRIQHGHIARRDIAPSPPTPASPLFGCRVPPKAKLKQARWPYHKNTKVREVTLPLQWHRCPPSSFPPRPVSIKQNTHKNEKKIKNRQHIQLQQEHIASKNRTRLYRTPSPSRFFFFTYRNDLNAHHLGKTNKTCQV